jgi:2'-5' RNA ligase
VTFDPNYPRFFIALLPPQVIQDYANQVIRELGDRYQTKTAKAPPHVTLQAPFQWAIAQVNALESCLMQFANRHCSVPITLSGFSSFPPRVLYINVQQTAGLMELQNQLTTELASALNIVDPKLKTRPFSPHMTVASRNITRHTFQQAWEELRSRPVEFEFVGDRLTLLVHDGHQWHIHQDFFLV